MADESTHPEDHDPDQASPDAAEAKGQEETPEDDMSWLTFASPENPLSDMKWRITVGQPAPIWPPYSAPTRPPDWPRTPCIVPLCGAPHTLSGTWCEQTDARKLLGPPIHIGGICHDTRSSEPEQYPPFADVKHESDLPPRLMLGAERTSFTLTHEGWQARWSTADEGWTEIRHANGLTTLEEAWHGSSFGPIALQCTSFSELMNEITPHYPGACDAFPLGDHSPNMLAIAVSDCDPGVALWPDGFIVHFVIPIPIGRACGAVKALDLASSLSEMEDDMIAQFWLEPATSVASIHADSESVFNAQLWAFSLQQADIGWPIDGVATSDFAGKSWLSIPRLHYNLIVATPSRCAPRIAKLLSRRGCDFMNRYDIRNGSYDIEWMPFFLSAGYIVDNVPWSVGCQVDESGLMLHQLRGGHPEARRPVCKTIEECSQLSAAAIETLEAVRQRGRDALEGETPQNVKLYGESSGEVVEQSDSPQRSSSPSTNQMAQVENWTRALAESKGRLLEAKETLASLPVRPEIRSRDGRLREGELFVPEWWPHVNLHIEVSLHLKEELGNGVSRSFFETYAADCLLDTLPGLAEESDTFLYCCFIIDEDDLKAIDASEEELARYQRAEDPVVIEDEVSVRHPLMSTDPLPPVGQLDTNWHSDDYVWDEMESSIGGRLVIGLKNTCLEMSEDEFEFRTDLLVYGPDEQTAREDWQWVASLLRPEYRRVQAEQAVKDATRAIEYQQEMLEQALSKLA